MVVGNKWYLVTLGCVGNNNCFPSCYNLFTLELLGALRPSVLVFRFAQVVIFGPNPTVNSQTPLDSHSPTLAYKAAILVSIKWDYCF